VDYRLLWGELTEEVLSDGFQFYATFYRSPPAIKALLHGMVGVGVLALVAKLFRWDDSAMFFDGTSIGMKNPARSIIICVIAHRRCFCLFVCSGAYVLAIAVYATVTIPTLKTVVEPLEVDSPEDRILALRVLSASNVITILLLGVLLTLQVRLPLPLTLAQVRFLMNEWNVGWTGICEKGRCCCFNPVRG